MSTHTPGRKPAPPGPLTPALSSPASTRYPCDPVLQCPAHYGLAQPTCPEHRSEALITYPQRQLCKGLPATRCLADAASARCRLRGDTYVEVARASKRLHRHTD